MHSFVEVVHHAILGCIFQNLNTCCDAIVLFGVLIGWVSSWNLLSRSWTASHSAAAITWLHLTHWIHCLFYKCSLMSLLKLSQRWCKSEHFDTFFTARCYAPAVLAMGLCLCLSVCLCLTVCLSQVGFLLKRRNTGTHKQHHTIPHGLWFSDAKDLREIRP